uniref:RNA-directed RNA polymerase n=1 Tax=Avian infectious bursal disease virus TaxID=10995 RepID=A0A1X9JJU5_IBDV|nr:RNA dependent RNA polymerase [Infectious bursal disease virus]
MSDIFNSPQARPLISAAFGIKPTAGPDVEELLIPKVWVPPEDPLASPSRLAKFLRENGYKVLQPRSLPENEEYETDQILPDLSWMRQIKGAVLKPTLFLPIGDQEYFPKYCPTHRPSKEKPNAYPPDIALLKQMIYLFLQVPEATDNLKDEVTLLTQNIRDKAYGSGTYMGQATRLVAMKEVATGRNPNKDPLKLGYTFESIAQLLDITLPVGPPGEDDKPWVPLTRVPSRMLVLTGDVDGDFEVEDYLPKINLKSSSGLPYVGRTKGETIGEMIAISNQFLRELSTLVKQGAGTKGSNKKKLLSMLSDYWYLSCGLLFPKAERYDKSTWLTKTRNIWSAPSPTHLMISMITWPVMSNSPNNVLNIEGCPSLYKFNPFRGGLNRIVEWILAPEEPKALVYADNIYIVHSNTWYSIDLEKGEANCTRQHMQAAMYYILTRGWSDNGDPMFNQTWATFAMNIAPALVVDSSCLIMNLQIKTYGQGSGNAATFINNHLLSTLVLDQWNLMRQPRPDSEEFKSIEDKLGINFKIERSIDDIKGKLRQLVLLAQPGYLIGGVEPEQSAPTFELDLLGWSATYPKNLGIYFPVLDKERLFCSAAYPKGVENKSLTSKVGIVPGIPGSLVLGIEVDKWFELPNPKQTLQEKCRLHSASFWKANGFPLDEFLAEWSELSEFGEAFEGFNIKLTVTPESLAELNRPVPPKPPNVNRPVNTGGLKAVSNALKTGRYRNEAGLSGLVLLATARSRLQDAVKAKAEAEKLHKSKPDDPDADWFERSETLSDLLEKADIASKVAHSALVETSDALEAVQSTSVYTPKYPEVKNPQTASNPVVGLHLPAKRATGVQAALLGAGTSRPMGMEAPTRSKNAAKMAKRRQRQKESRQQP